MSLKPKQIKYLKIATGLGLVFISIYFIYNAIESKQVHVKGSEYILEQSPIAYYFFVVFYFLTTGLGFIMTRQGIRNEI